MLVLVYFHRKAPRGPPGLMSPSDRQIAINTTYAFSTSAHEVNMLISMFLKFGYIRISSEKCVPTIKDMENL